MIARPRPTHDLVEEVDYLIKHPTAHEKIFSFLKKLSEETFAAYSKETLFGLLKQLTEALESTRAITLCQIALDKTSLLGQRFWKQGPVNESNFTRGHIKSIYNLLQSLQKKRADSQPPEKLLRESSTFTSGELAFKEKDYAKAALFFKSTITANRQNASAYSYLGLCFVKTDTIPSFAEIYPPLHHLKEAVHWCSQAILTDPNNGHFYFNRATAYIMQKRYLEALYDINETINLNKQANSNIFSSNYWVRGELYLKLNIFSPKEIIANFDIVVKHYPDDYLSFYQRGLIHDSIWGYTKEAAEDYMKAAELYTAANPQSSLEKQGFYKKLKVILRTTEAEALDRLSKNELMELITKITRHLSAKDAYDLCEFARTPGNPLSKRLHKEEKILGIFEGTNVIPALQELSEHYKANYQMTAKCSN